MRLGKGYSTEEKNEILSEAHELAVKLLRETLTEFCVACGDRFNIEEVITECMTCWNPAHPWFSTKLRMPEKDGRYLVVEHHHGQWVGVTSLRDGQFEIPTSHWMPLPEKPK